MAYRCWLVAAFCAAFLSGCNGGSLSDAAGHYEGFMVLRAATQPEQSSVSADVAIPSDSELMLKLSTEPASKEIDFDVQISDGKIDLSSPSGFVRDLLTLQQDPSDDHCYSNSGSELCFDGTELKIVLNVGSVVTKFVLDRLNPTSNPSPVPSMETPQTFAIDQLMDRTRARNFSTEASFESVVQAKLTAQTAYLNLLPHINVGSGLDLYGFVTTSMVHAVGDFAPFFLPDRWFQAAADADTANADFDSYRVVQASAMNVVQGLALSVIRDEQALEVLEQNRVAITEVRDEVLAAEQNGTGTVQVGTSDDITSILTSLMMSIDAMRQTIVTEKTALSQGAGFMNPEAVSGVQPVPLPTINGPVPDTLADYEQAGIQRSIQLLQMDDLIEAARNMKNARSWQWLDPSGDDQGSIGFGIVKYVEVGSAMVQQMYDLKANSQSVILQTVDTAFHQSKQISDQYQLAVKESTTAEARVQRLLMNFRTGISFAMADLVSALHDKAQGDIDQVNAQYAYLTLQAQMDFLTYSGYYATLLGEKY